MDKKVVFLDVDGTMVNEKGEIPESAQYAVRTAQANGHRMVVCSGRSRFQIYDALLELGFSGIVGGAGAFVEDEGKEFYHAYIDEEHRKSSFDYLEGQAAGLYQKIGTDLLPKLSGCAIFLVKKGIGAISSLFIFFLSVLLILLDDKMPAVRGRLRPFVQKLRGAGLAYLKAQSLLLFIIAALLALGFYFMGNDYAILLAIGIALLDAFPVLGSGMVLIPWAVLSVIGGRYYDAAIVTTLFCVVTFLREILEPRLIGKEVGIKPFYLIISVYAGIELCGIGGVILGPVSLTILKAVREELIERERT